MATLYLIRHGQASFGQDNYDQLSPTGWQQGRILGRWMAGRVAPGAIFGGALRRHRETVEAITTGYGQSLPDMQVLTDLNEYDYLEVVHRLRPEWADRDIMARDLAAFPNPAKAFQQTFEQAMARWVSGAYDQEYRESWEAFRGRVIRALDTVIEWADGADVLVSTSAGPIAVMVQHLLELPDSRALAVNNVIVNTSVSRILYSGPRRSLAVFNNYSHLEAEDPALVTYR